MRTLLLGIIVSTSVACTPKDAGQVNFGDTNSALGDGGSDSNSSGDSGADGGSDGGSGEVFDDTDPVFNAEINGGSWRVSPGEEGHSGYFTTNTLYAQQMTSSGTAQTVSIQLDGDLQVPGTYDVLYVSYTLQVAQDTPTVYDVKNPDGFKIHVLGYAKEGYSEELYVFAESEGEAAIGGDGTFAGVEIENYPYFYAR